ncbi:MAG: tetratricopeptide repeat-containing sulfotransferase family protein [Caulobacterales bacterium]
MDNAKHLALKALAAGHEHPLLLNLRALDHEEAGRLDQALEDLTRAHVLAPRDFSILNACGLCLSRMDRPREALQCYEQAIAIEPKFGPASFNSGWAFDRLGETAKAAKAFARAAELDPRNAPAWANMAWLAVRRGDRQAAREYADRALVLQPDQPTAHLALARVELDEPHLAERRLMDLLARPDLGANDTALALNQLGDALHALGRPSEAFASYTKSNALFRAEAAARFEAPGQLTVADMMAWLVPWAQRLDAREWAPPRARATSRRAHVEHVFLLGFPRSGTTLMESVLAGHPKVVSLEERFTLEAAVTAFMGSAESMSRLASLRDAELQVYRDDYWACVKSFGVDVRDKIFIDKNPFNTFNLAVIYKLFPDAKIIFAIRDPRDVVLSCFRRMFRLNASTHELLDLKRAASFYDQTMRFWQIMREKQPLEEHQLVYERLVANFEAEASAACAFIGADWRPELAQFAERARKGNVASVSSDQIARGLFTDGAGQWRRYRAELAPVLETLAPWVERFGYPPD